MPQSMRALHHVGPGDCRLIQSPAPDFKRVKRESFPFLPLREMLLNGLIIFFLSTAHFSQCERTREIDEVDDEFIRSLVERLTSSVDSLARQINSGKALSQANHGSTTVHHGAPRSPGTTSTPIPLPLLPEDDKTDTTTSAPGQDGVSRILSSFLDLIRSLSTRMGGEEMNELLLELTRLIQSSLRMITSAPLYSPQDLSSGNDDQWNSIIETIRQVLMRHRVNAIITHRQIRNNHTSDYVHSTVQVNCTYPCERGVFTDSYPHLSRCD